MTTSVDIYVIGYKGGVNMRTDNVYTYLNTKISGNWIENATIVPKDGVSGEFIGNSVVI